MAFRKRSTSRRALYENKSKQHCRKDTIAGKSNIKINMKELVYKILWSTIEDFVGLWEILWELNSVMSENGQIENQELAKKILRYFLVQKLIKLYINKWGSDDLEELQFKEAIKILDDEKYWNAPKINALCIKIGNTEFGEKFYNQDLLGDFI